MRPVDWHEILAGKWSWDVSAPWTEQALTTSNTALALTTGAIVALEVIDGDAYVLEVASAAAVSGADGTTGTLVRAGMSRVVIVGHKGSVGIGNMHLAARATATAGTATLRYRELGVRK